MIFLKLFLEFFSLEQIQPLWEIAPKKVRKTDTSLIFEFSKI